MDSCAFDPKYSPEDTAAQALIDNDSLNLVIADSNMKEIAHPNTPPGVKSEAASRIYTIETNLTPDEKSTKQEIHRILTGNGKPEKMEADAAHVFESHKYGGYFITTDRRVLDKRDEISAVANAKILKPSELLDALQHAYA
jgi:hypothetical protein